MRKAIKKLSMKNPGAARIRGPLERYRPLEKGDGIGPAAKGMRHDEGNGLYYLASEADAEINYLLGQLKDLGWTDCRENFRPKWV